ncbi:hypothetical protein GCM10027174_09920 [Salinifilum aidingensis]
MRGATRRPQQAHGQSDGEQDDQRGNQRSATDLAPIGAMPHTTSAVVTVPEIYLSDWE